MKELFKTKNFEYKDELIEYMIEQFAKQDFVSLICDYDIAKIFANIYEDEDFSDYYGIDLQSDVYEYIVSRIENEFFCIEPIKKHGEYLEIESTYLFIQEELACRELIRKVDADNIEIVSYDEEYECDCDDCSECSGCYIEENYNTDCEQETSDCTTVTLSEEVEEFLDFIIDELDELMCPECQKDVLRRLYQVAYDDGRNSLACALGEVMNGIVEGKYDR